MFTAPSPGFTGAVAETMNSFGAGRESPPAGGCPPSSAIAHPQQHLLAVGRDLKALHMLGELLGLASFEHEPAQRVIAAAAAKSRLSCALDKVDRARLARRNIRVVARRQAAAERCGPRSHPGSRPRCRSPSASGGVGFCGSVGCSVASLFSCAVAPAGVASVFSFASSLTCAAAFSSSLSGATGESVFADSASE